MRQFGLIGKSLNHSFSKTYFENKFFAEHISDCRYDLFPLSNISEIDSVVKTNTDLEGFNVTIPFKKSIIPYLHELDSQASEVGAVNTVKISRTKDHFFLKGFNTDVIGFESSLHEILPFEGALILGTGGAAEAVGFVLKKLEIPCLFVSRNKSGNNTIGYNDLTRAIIRKHPLIVNTTPLGMFPDTNNQPPIPYQYLSGSSYLYDLIYNPEETLFLKNGREKGAQIKNGLQMLHNQADKSWEIWNLK